MHTGSNMWLGGCLLVLVGGGVAGARLCVLPSGRGEAPGYAGDMPRVGGLRRFSVATHTMVVCWRARLPSKCDCSSRARVPS